MRTTTKIASDLKKGDQVLVVNDGLATVETVKDACPLHPTKVYVVVRTDIHECRVNAQTAVMVLLA